MPLFEAIRHGCRPLARVACSPLGTSTRWGRGLLPYAFCRENSIEALTISAHRCGIQVRRGPLRWGKTANACATSEALIYTAAMRLVVTRECPVQCFLGASESLDPGRSSRGPAAADPPVQCPSAIGQHLSSVDRGATTRIRQPRTCHNVL